MVKMTEEQKAQRMAARRRAEAEAEEARELRREAKRREWLEKSMYLTYDEMMSGMPCRGCGEILWDGKGDPVTTSSGGASRSYKETLVFDGQGSYRWSSAAQVAVTTPGVSAGSASGATTDGDQGSYTVIGNTLVLEGTKGQLAVDIQLGNRQLLAAGKRYARQ